MIKENTIPKGTTMLISYKGKLTEDEFTIEAFNNNWQLKKFIGPDEFGAYTYGTCIRL